MVINNALQGWSKFIPYVTTNEIMNLLIQNADRICPAFEDIFKAFKLCNYNNLKVVMLGQDPYPQKGVATGILFGNRREVSEENLSYSLKIVKNAAINLEIPHTNIIFDQTLESWAKQGILMINSALTVEVGRVGSHVMLWRPVIANILTKLSIYTTGIIYVLFGEQAKTFRPYINEKTNIIILEKHPAYYARIGRRMPSDVFDRISKLTKEKYGEPIKWFEEY